MCGQYVSTRRPQDLAQLFHVDTWPTTEALAPSWNVAPTDDVWAVLEHPRTATVMTQHPCGSCGRCAGAWCRPGRRSRTRPSARPSGEVQRRQTRASGQLLREPGDPSLKWLPDEGRRQQRVQTGISERQWTTLSPHLVPTTATDLRGPRSTSTCGTRATSSPTWSRSGSISVRWSPPWPGSNPVTAHWPSDLLSA